MSKHTPGPWRIESQPHVVWSNYGALIARVPVYIGERDELWEEKIANARLIAAAPEMLNAIEAFINADRSEHLAARLNDAEMAAVESMKAAITKARGA